MVEKHSFNWRLPLYAAAGTLLVFLPFALYSADFGELLYVFIAAPIISVVLIVLAIVKKARPRLSVLSMLIVDPGDSLAAVPKDHPPGKLSGIPCEVPRIRRLERHWNAVMFYTDTLNPPGPRNRLEYPAIRHRRHIGR